MTEFHGVFALLDTETNDGRLVKADGVVFRPAPFPLMAMEQIGNGYGSRIVGRIDGVWTEGDEIRGQGILDEGPFGGDDEAQGILDIVGILNEDGLIYGGADFDQHLFHNEESVLVTTSARFIGFTLYPDGSQSAFGDRTWIKEGPWPQ